MKGLNPPVEAAARRRRGLRANRIMNILTEGGFVIGKGGAACHNLRLTTTTLSIGLLQLQAFAIRVK